MANYGFNVAKFGVTTASGSTAIVDFSNYIDTYSGAELSAIVQESHAMGDSWAESLYAGIRKMAPITVGGFYQDVASGPHAYFGQTTDLGAKRQAEVDFGSSDIVHFSYLLTSYKRQPKRNELTRFEAVLQPTGTVSTAT